MQDLVDWFLGTPIKIALIVLLAVVLRSVLIRSSGRVIRRAMLLRRSRSANTPATPEALIDQNRHEQRASAISQLFKSVISVAVWTIAGIMVLSNLGIDVGPILASAGVVGVALGFGAQTLVKDYLAGIFMILEDQYGVGDLIDVGSVVGTVEEVGLRVTRLRDLSGVVWYVRNGEILRVANRSQGWTIASVDIPINYESNLTEVRQIIDRVATEITEDETTKDLVIDKPEYAGVESVSGEAVIIRVTARTLPDKQVPAAREIRERIKLAFDQAGIKVPAVLRIPGQPTKH
jgi:small conductance mechanosensitive channel